jgi:small-conductance mechanosensitive channel
MPVKLSRLLLVAIMCIGGLTLATAPSRHAAAAENEAPAAAPAPVQPAVPAEPAAPAVPAQPTTQVQPGAPSLFPPELAQRVARLASDIENAAKGIERVKHRESGLAAQRVELERIEVEAQQVIAALRPRLDAVAAQLQKLGPTPDKDAAPEAPAIATERARLSAANAEVGGAIKTAELTLVRARQLVGHVQNLRQALFARDLLLRSGSPLAFSTWQQLAAELPRAVRQIANLAFDWWRTVGERLSELVLVIGGAAAVYAALRWALSRLWRRRQSSTRHYGLASYFPNAANAIWAAATRGLPPLAAAGVLYSGLATLDLLTVTVGEFALAALWAFAIYIGIQAGAGAALSSRPPDHPLIDIADSSAPKLLRLTNAFATLLALDLLLSDVVRMLYLPLEIGVVQAGITSLAVAALLIAFVRVPLASRQSALLEPPSRARPRWLKLPLTILALAIIGTTLAGYVALGQFMSKQVMLVGGTALALFFVHVAIRRVAAVLIEGDRPIGRILEARLGLDHQRTSYLTRMLVFLFEFLLLLAVVPAVLLTWGFAREDLLDWPKLGIVGFQIGQFQFSLARILLAVLLFLALLSGTRFIQRWLDRSVLGPARVDRAISHSVLMGVGYTGVALATIIALSYAGLDFTQLAIVAGALSLGIGFGLQAIFNNFVSGIILLVERPIKVGDWIVVGTQEGFVRRINVRATEIETFDRASLIIPNSELVTGSVTNWTHRNPIGRLVIYVRVSYKADPEQVLAILVRVAEQSTSLLREPGPTAVFEDFAESAMLFSLRCFVPDVGSRLGVGTELRVAISKAFREAGIEIAYPQHDVHLRDLDGVRSALTRALEARRRENEGEAEAI